MAWTGFNTSTRQYEATRISSTNTIRIAEAGTYDEKTKQFDLKAEYPMARDTWHPRTVIELTSADAMIATSYLSFGSVPEWKAEPSLRSTTFALQLTQQVGRTDELIAEDPARDIQKFAHLRIAQGVADGRPELVRRDDAVGPEHRELLGHDGLRDFQRMLELLHGAIAAPEDLQDANAERVGQGSKELGLERLQTPNGGAGRSARWPGHSLTMIFKYCYDSNA